MQKILSGKDIAKQIKTQTKEIISEYSLLPRMLLIQVGSDPASAYYVQNIISNGTKLGCYVQLNELADDASEADLLSEINRANRDPEIHGIMIQKPLPKAFDTAKIDISINPDKDLDAIHPLNLGKIVNETGALVPCTAQAVIETLKFFAHDPAGKHVVILGRSTVLGKPLANMLLQKKAFANATVSVCHSKTTNLSELTRQADILIAAIGSPLFVKADMIKENCILVDVGINLQIDASGKEYYVGDIDYKDCYDKALAITPVPGGIGTITTSILLRNLALSAFMTRFPNKSIDVFC